jgi:hypothetical protein
MEKRMKIKRGEIRWSNPFEIEKFRILFLLILIVIVWAVFMMALSKGIIRIPDTVGDRLQAECETVYVQLQGDISDLDRDILMNRLGALDAELIKRFSNGCQLEGK